MASSSTNPPGVFLSQNSSELCSLPYSQDTTHFTSCLPPVPSLSSEPRMMGNASHQSGPRFLSSRLAPPTTAAVTRPSQCSQSAVNTKHFCFSQNPLQLDRKTDSYFVVFPVSCQHSGVLNHLNSTQKSRINRETGFLRYEQRC